MSKRKRKFGKNTSLGNGSDYDILKRSDLLKFAQTHWNSFFQPWQEMMGDIPEIPPLDHTEYVTHDIKKLYEHKCKELDKEDRCDDIFKFYGGQEFLSQRSCATFALLNDCRRKGLQEEIPQELVNLEPPFDRKTRFNFEGTRDDHYCLGSRGFGEKRYTGLTDDLEKRHREHSGVGEFDGSAFIAVLTGLKQCRSCCTCAKLKPLGDNRGGKLCAAPDPYGGFTLVDKNTAGKITADHSEGPYRYTESEENDLTIRLVKTHGIFHARGGEYVFTEASFCSDVSMAVRIFANAGAACTLCSMEGHHRSKCPLRFRGRNDDETRQMLWNLECEDHDRRITGSHYTFAKAITLALVNNACEGEKSDIGRLVQLTDEYEEPGNLELNGAVRRIVSELYGQNRSDNLRPLQKQALNHISNLNRPDIALTLPTAYGKTLVYLVAAVYEILQARKGALGSDKGSDTRRGKVVVFLPYRALMSDVTEALAELTNPWATWRPGDPTAQPRNDNAIWRFMNGRIVVNEDGGLNGVSMPYAGEFYVSCADADADASARHESIRWTIWRGASGDRNITKLEKTKMFKDADIIFATPDKWSWPVPMDDNSQNSCDSFIETFGKEFMSSLRLCIIDEAHEFREILGGNMRELLKRMEEMKKHIPNNSGTDGYRMLVISATIPDPQQFTKDLTGRDGSNLTIVPEPHQLEASQHTQTQTCNPWPENPGEDPTEDDVDKMFRDINIKQGARHKVLVIFKHEITPDILCKNLLKPENLPGVRRVLIFVDSKDIATKIVRSLLRDSFMNSWRAKKYKVTVTPYHAGVAPSSRTLCDKTLAKFVKGADNDSAPKQVHFIIATSALEAGVNIKGIDAIVILSALACNRRSLIQRYGRGGREKDKPTVIMIGYESEGQSAQVNVASDGADQDINTPDDSHASDGQSAAPASVEADNDDDEGSLISFGDPEDSPDFIRQPKRFLRLNDAPFSVCNTRAMRIHGACQFLSALIHFKQEFAQRVVQVQVQESVINLMKPDQGKVQFGELVYLNPEDWIMGLMAALKEQLDGELPISGEAMSMRAISGRTLKVYEADKNDRIHRYNVRMVRLGNSRKYKDLGRVSETMLFRNLHWNAQFYTPHGRLVRVVSLDLDSKATDPNWNNRIRSIIVQAVQRTGLPYVTQGDSHEHIQFSSDLTRDPDHEANGSEVEVGKVVVKTTWLGFSYRNPYDNSKITHGFNNGDHLLHLYESWKVPISAVPRNTKVGSVLLRTWEFFMPAISSKNGWRWNVSQNFPLATHPLRSLVLRALCAELRLRLSNALHFSPSQITICLSSRKLQKYILEAEKRIEEDWTTNTMKVSNTCLVKQDNTAWQEVQSARLILFEHSNAGIAIECLRVLLPPSDAAGGSLLHNVDKLELDNKSHRKSLRDSKIMEKWEDRESKLRELVIDCLRWLKGAALDVRQREKWS